MPLYEYMCKKCRKIHEVLVPLSEEKEDVKCPECDKAMKKLMSPIKSIRIN